MFEPWAGHSFCIQGLIYTVHFFGITMTLLSASLSIRVGWQVNPDVQGIRTLYILHDINNYVSLPMYHEL